MLPVCDDGGLLVGVISVDDLAAVAQEEWSTTAVADAMRPRPPVAAPDWPLSEVGRAMEENGLDVMLVVAPHAPDRVLGAITAGDIVALHEILGTVEGT
jgi:CBS domain-containing protein